jgi:hypothetical protein
MRRGANVNVGLVVCCNAQRVIQQTLIDPIEVFSVGRKVWIEEKISEALLAMLEASPNMTKNELEQVEIDLRSKIENEELRQYNIYFKGGSWRVMKPANS